MQPKNKQWIIENYISKLKLKKKNTNLNVLTQISPITR